MTTQFYPQGGRCSLSQTGWVHYALPRQAMPLRDTLMKHTKPLCECASSTLLYVFPILTKCRCLSSASRIVLDLWRACEKPVCRSDHCRQPRPTASGPPKTSTYEDRALGEPALHQTKDQPPNPAPECE